MVTDGETLSICVEAALLDGDATELTIIPEAHAAGATALRIAGGCVGLASWALRTLHDGAASRLARFRKAGEVSLAARAAGALLAANACDLRGWGARKSAYVSLSAELALTSLLLSAKPKAAEAWSHRAWALRRAGWPTTLLSIELELARRAASRARANYYAGVHRVRVLKYVTSEAVAEELRIGRKWLQTHPSDPSAWWYHTALVRRLRDDNRSDLIDVQAETEFANDMLQRYGGNSLALRKHTAWWNECCGKEATVR